MGIDEKVVEQKIEAGEELTKEEQEFVMGYPNVEEGDAAGDEGADSKGRGSPLDRRNIHRRLR